jgi:alpha-ketoglutaric semialdehyde dehydrogenase
VEPVLIAGAWRAATASGSFRAVNPATALPLEPEFPISAWSDVEEALEASSQAAVELRTVPAEKTAMFLGAYAAAIEANAISLAELASSETALAVAPRLKDVELPRTVTQLRQAANAAGEGSWQHCVLDTKLNIRSHLAPLGPVLVIGPNNFPFAFNGISGGDMAAAIAAGNPVIAKAHPLHPGTTKALAMLASKAVLDTGLPAATVQMIYHVSPEDGLRLVSDRRLGAVAFTGSRGAGLRIKAAADAAGVPAYLEMSSLNPIVLLPGAVNERADKLVAELADSCLAASGQFCTSPNLILLIAGEAADAVVAGFAKTLEQQPVAPLLSHSGLTSLEQGVQSLIAAGASLVIGGSAAPGEGYRYRNTLLRADGATFLRNHDALQREAFGNATLVITAEDLNQLADILRHLEGNLTGSIYSSTTGEDEASYAVIEPELRSRVGRLLNDKMPTGVALSPAMNHGGPYPATGHPLFTSVGIPASMIRFAALQCYDNVRHERLPAALQDHAPHQNIWRGIDGAWVKG